MSKYKGCVRWAQQLGMLLATVAAGCGGVSASDEGAEELGSVTSALTTAARHSLLITELKVVADAARTVEPCLAVPEDANTKVWSLPYLLKVEAARTGKDPADFVTNWLNAWSTETPLVNEQTGRRNGVQEVMDRWGKDGSGKFRIEKAPFRLSAIVSRLDLRNLRPEGEPLGGEVRFVFGLTETAACGAIAAETTLILEYSPGTKTENEVLAWAKRWYNLGKLDKSSAQYLTDLQGLTEDTIRKGKLQRIRSNAVKTDETVTPGWFMSEFVPVGGWLVRTTVKQTPRNELRDPRNGNRAKAAAFIAANAANLGTVFEVPQKGYMYNPGSGYRVPDKFDGTLIPFRGTFAITSKDVPGVAWEFPKPTEVDAFTWSQARHRFSLGTCNGCHGAELAGKTSPGLLFHIRPREMASTAPISQFLSGPMTVTDPVDGTQRSFDEMLRRQDDLHWLANELPLGNPIFGNYYKMRFVHSGKCLDVEGRSLNDGGLVKQYGCHGNDNQRLALVPAAQPWEFKIKLQHSQLCLDVENGSTATGAKVVQKACSASSNSQVFTWLVPPGTPEAVILTFKHSGKCLKVGGQSTSDAAQVVQSDCVSDRARGLHLVE